jgi:hypothetical protein
MRTLWILFSALIAALVVALCIASPVDPLRWAADAAIGPALQGIPAGEPVARFADAALIGIVVAYLLIFIPLSAASWIDGGRRSAAIRAALMTAPSDAPTAPSSVDSATPWWPLLAPYAAEADGEVPERSAGPKAVPSAKTGRSAVIDGIVAHQSGAAVFADFPVIALGLGFIALMGQLLPVLAADPGAIVGAGSTAAGGSIGDALARGFCSLVAATAAAALFSLMSRLMAAILRQRAESICGALDQASRGWGNTMVPEAASLTMTPLPQAVREQREGVDDALVEHVAARIWQLPGAPGRDVAESVDNAIRELHATTLRPMLHDISRLLSLLGERAAHLVTTVDDRLGQQSEHTRQMLAATQQISQALSKRAGAGTSAALPSDLAVDELRQALRDERSAAVALLRSTGEEITGQLDTTLKSAARSIVRPLSVQAEAVRKMVEHIGTTAATLARSGSVIEQSVGAMEQQLVRLATTPQPLPGTVTADGGTVDIAALVQPLATQAEAVRHVVERIDAAAEAMARAGSMIVQSSGAIEQKLDRLTSLPEAPRTNGASDAAMENIAVLLQPLTTQAEAVRQVVERIDAAAATMARTGSVIEHSTGAIEQTLDRLTNLPEMQRSDGVSGAAMEGIAAVLQPLATQAEAVRQVAERIDAAAEAMARAGSMVEQSTGALGQKLDRLADMPGALPGGSGSAAAAADIAAIAKASREALESLAALSDQLKQTVPAAAARDAPPPRHAENGEDAGTASWAQRVSALHRASIDLTSDLPALEIPAATPEGRKSVLESESGT